MSTKLTKQVFLLSLEECDRIAAGLYMLESAMYNDDLDCDVEHDLPEGTTTDVVRSLMERLDSRKFPTRLSDEQLEELSEAGINEELDKLEKEKTAFTNQVDHIGAELHKAGSRVVDQIIQNSKTGEN